MVRNLINKGDNVSVLNNIKSILDELKELLTGVSEEEVENFKTAVISADRIFVAGAGRSLLMARSFAMRLMQTGFTSYVVGETVTPAIRNGDLLIIASGSGETSTLKVIAANANKAGAKIALLTSNPDSAIAKLSDCIVQIHTSTPKLEEKQSVTPSVQPGASAFEQSVLLLCDALVIDLKPSDSVSDRNAALMKLHANLE